MFQIPDHPIIRDCERYGYPRWMCERVVIDHCINCGRPIFDGDDYSECDDGILCDECAWEREEEE